MATVYCFNISLVLNNQFNQFMFIIKGALQETKETTDFLTREEMDLKKDLICLVIETEEQLIEGEVREAEVVGDHEEVFFITKINCYSSKIV